MPVELLFLIPVAALAFLPFILMASQKKAAGQDNAELKLQREVEAFNDGRQPAIRSTQTIVPHMAEIEKTIGLVSQALSQQQTIIDKFGSAGGATAGQIAELKEKLMQLQREYDLVVSENFSLRARVKKLSQEVAAMRSGAPAASRNPQRFKDTESLATSNPNLDDTRELSPPDLK